MPRAGGVYTLPAGNPVVTLTVISSAWANTTMSDIALALTGSVPTDGSAAMTGPLRIADGAVGAPGLAFATETTSGLYRIGIGDFGFSIASVKALEITASTLTFTSKNASATNALVVKGGTTAGDLGMSVSGGTAAADSTAIFKNAANTITLANILATGGFSLGWNGAASTISGAAAGNVTVPAPAVAGSTLTVTAPSNGAGVATAITANSNIGTSVSNPVVVLQGGVGVLSTLALCANGIGPNSDSLYLMKTAAGNATVATQSGVLTLGAGTATITLGPTGGVTISTPTSAVTTLVLGGSDANNYLSWSNGTSTAVLQSSTVNSYIGTTTATAFSLISNNATRMTFDSAGNISLPTNGVSATATTGASGAPPAQVAVYMTISVLGTARKIALYNT